MQHNRILLVGIVLLLATLACSTPTTPTGTPEPPTGTLTPTGTENPAETPTATHTATVEPSATPTNEFDTPTPRVTPGPELPNLLTAGDFNGNYTPRDPLNATLYVADGWKPFYCAPPYTAEDCPAERIGDGNPEGLLMGIPEYRPTDLENRVVEGLAQQWFCFFRACRAGIYQVVETPPNATCELGVWVQTWSAGNWIGDDGPYTSFYQTDDERANSSWRLGADPTGGTNAFADTVQWGESSGYDAGHFDHFALVTYRFNTTGTQTTVFIENLRLWPFAHNDSYVDDAYLRCTQ